MSSQPHLRTASDDAPAGAIPEIESGGVTMAVCTAIVAVCFAAPLFLTLPQALEAAARPAPAVIDTGAGATPEPTLHERYPVAATSTPEWVETF